MPLRWDMLLGGLIACVFYQTAHELMDPELAYEGSKSLGAVEALRDVKPQPNGEWDAWIGTERETTLVVPVKYGDKAYTRVTSRAVVRRGLIAGLSRALPASKDVERTVDEVTTEYRLDLSSQAVSTDHVPPQTGQSLEPMC